MGRSNVNTVTLYIKRQKSCPLLCPALTLLPCLGEPSNPSTGLTRLLGMDKHLSLPREPRNPPHKHLLRWEPQVPPPQANLTESALRPPFLRSVRPVHRTVPKPTTTRRTSELRCEPPLRDELGREKKQRSGRFGTPAQGSTDVLYRHSTPLRSSQSRNKRFLGLFRARQTEGRRLRIERSLGHRVAF